MKLKLLAGLICSTCFASTTLAQSNLTIYGIADAGVQVSSFGNGTQYDLGSGIAEGSRLGFKGIEDIGGGYKAIFTLEARIELDTGTQSNGYLSSLTGQALTQGLPPAIAAALRPALQPATIVNGSNALFDRQAYVGLITPVGAVLMGRQYTPGFEIYAMADTFEIGTAGSWTTISSGTGGLLTPGIAIRANNTLQYRMEAPNGIGASLMYGVEATGSLGLAKHFRGANVKYVGKGFAVGLGYNNEDTPTGMESLRTITAGGSYTMGDVKLFAGYHNMRNDNSALVPLLAPSTGAAAAAVVGNNATIKADVYSLGAHYHIGAGRLMAGISRLNDKKTTNSDATLYGLGYDHFLSKRTDVYVFFAHVSNQNTGQYALGGAGYSGGFTSQPGRNGNALQLGIRHKF